MILCQGCVHGTVQKRASTDLPIVHCRATYGRVPPDITFCSRYMPGIPMGRNASGDYYMEAPQMVDPKEPPKSKDDKGTGVYL